MIIEIKLTEKETKQILSDKYSPMFPDKEIDVSFSYSHGTTITFTDKEVTGENPESETKGQ